MSTTTAAAPATVAMMNLWQTEMLAGNFANAASVYTETGVLTVVGTAHTGRAEIEGFFAAFAPGCTNVGYTITSEGTDTYSGVYDFGAAGQFDYVINLAPGTADIVSEVVTPVKTSSAMAFMSVTFEFGLGDQPRGKLATLKQLLVDAEVAGAFDQYLACQTHTAEDDDKVGVSVAMVLADGEAWGTALEASGIGEFATMEQGTAGDAGGDADWTEGSDVTITTGAVPEGCRKHFSGVIQGKDGAKEVVAALWVGKAPEGVEGETGPRVIGRMQPTFSHGDKCAADFIKILYTSTEGYEAPSFDSLDTDGDGKISKEELNAGLIKAISKPGQPFPGLKPNQLQDLMDFMDEDHDGSVDPEEFTKLGAMYKKNADVKAHAEGADWDVVHKHVESGTKMKPSHSSVVVGGGGGGGGGAVHTAAVDWSAPASVSTMDIMLMPEGDMLAALGDDVDKQDKWGFSTLMHAIIWKEAAKANALVNKGADVNCATTAVRSVNGTTFAIGSTPNSAGYAGGAPEPDTLE